MSPRSALRGPAVAWFECVADLRAVEEPTTRPPGVTPAHVWRPATEGTVAGWLLPACAGPPYSGSTDLPDKAWD